MDQSQEITSPILTRSPEHLLRGSLLDDHALIHEEHPIRHLAREPHFMRDDRHRHALSRQLLA